MTAQRTHHRDDYRHRSGGSVDYADGPGPDKRIYTTKVADREALKQVKVGDRLDITFAAAVLVSADPPKK